jgi:hypothetical protein
MIIPLRWMLKRPGWLIPVFFLSGIQPLVSGQDIWPEASAAALGGAFVTRSGASCAGLNQAGLGRGDQHVLCLQHSRPYLLRELGQSSLSGNFIAGHGAVGLMLSTRGLKGLRQSSFWLSYGMKLHPDISAGLGIHFWNSSLAEELFYATGISFALGIQARIHPQWMVGVHVKYPASWSSLDLPFAFPRMVLAAGFSHTFLNSATIYSEVHITPRTGIRLVQGLEWHLSGRVSMSAGFSNLPNTFAWGISLLHSAWDIRFAFQYRTQSGTVPFTSLSHAW